MHFIQLWSDIGQKWVQSLRPGLVGGMAPVEARSQVKTLLAAKWRIVDKAGNEIKHGSAAHA